jgi:phage-related protein
MSERLTIRLWEPMQAFAAITNVWKEWLKPKFLYAANDGHKVRFVMEIRPETRSDAQNRLLHSRLGDIAKQLEWCGCKRDTDTWKRLLTASWLRARGEHVEILPALDGHGVDVVFRPTSKLSRAECSELSEFIMAWGSEREVDWCAASLAEDA